MSNLLRVELFKVVHGKVFWVLFNIVIMISLLIVVLFFLGEKGILEKLEELDGVDITVEVDQSQSELLSANGINLLIDQIQEPGPFLTVFIISVLGSFLIATEYSNGVIKNIVSIGYHREEIYFAKYIIYTLSSIVLVLIFPVAFGFFGTLFFGLGDWPTSEILIQTGKIVFLNFLYVIAFSSVVKLFSNIVNSSGLAFIVSIGFYLIFGPVLDLLSYQYVIFEKLNHYSIYNRFSLLSNSNLASKDLLELGMLPVIWTAIFVTVGLIMFKKKDIQ